MVLEELVRLATPFKVQHGALVEAPVHSNDKRAKNWLAAIAPNPQAPGGLDRQFVTRGNGQYLYMVTDLQVGTAVEFGADKVSSTGNRRPNRAYGVVVNLTDDALMLARCDTALEAMELADEVQQALLGRKE